MGFAGYGSLYDSLAKEADPADLLSATRHWRIPGSSLYDSADAVAARQRAGEEPEAFGPPAPSGPAAEGRMDQLPAGFNAAGSGRVSPAAFSESDLFDEGPSGGGQTNPSTPAEPPIRPELQRVMDLARARGGDPTFNPTSGIGYNGSGYVLTAEEQKQVEDLDGAISKVKQQDDLDDVQKGMALQQLQQKRHALDPGGNYGPRSARGQMTPAAKWASQNVYKDPQSGLIFYNDGHGWKHVKDEHADRVHQAVIKAKDHAHEAEQKRQDRAQELEVKRQERAEKLESDTAGKKKKEDHDTSKEIYDHAKQRVKDVMQHNKDLISGLDPETAKKFAKMTAEEKAEFGIQKIPTLEDAEDAEVESRAKRGLSTGLHKSVGQREASDLLATVPKGANGGFDLSKDTNAIRLNKIDKMLDKPWLLGVSQAEADAFRRLVRNRIAQLTVQQ